jgi:hypothetical protein
MGVPTSEVGYASATTRRETMKSMTDMWWHWKTTTTYNTVIYANISFHIRAPASTNIIQTLV